MLNNPKRVLDDWLRQQPADGTYDWDDPTKCLVGQFLGGRVGSEHDYAKIPSYYRIAFPRPHTFGAALARAEALER